MKDLAKDKAKDRKRKKETVAKKRTSQESYKSFFQDDDDYGRINRRYYFKKSIEYSEFRKKNNEAVKRSRIASKKDSKLKEKQLEELKKYHDHLQKKIATTELVVSALEDIVVSHQGKWCLKKFFYINVMFNFDLLNKH